MLKAKKIFIFAGLTSCLIIFLLLPSTKILKATGPSWPGWEIDYPWNPPEPNLPSYVNYIYQFAFWVASFLAVLMIIVGGIQWMSSAASPQQKMAAKNKITRSIIGLVALFAIFVVLRAINPEILELKDTVISEVTPSYNYSGPKTNLDIAMKIQKDVKSKFKMDYSSGRNMEGESQTPCECAGTEGGVDNRCGTYCFHACRRYVALKETGDKNNINSKVYGLMKYCARLTGNDPVMCSCYESNDTEISEVSTFEIGNACEFSGNEQPKCLTEQSEYCYDYCKERGFKFGYISRGYEDAGRGLDLVWCTCVR